MEALRSYEQARAIWQKLVNTHPKVTEFQSNLAFSYNNIEPGRCREILRWCLLSRSLHAVGR